MHLLLAASTYDLVEQLRLSLPFLSSVASMDDTMDEGVCYLRWASVRFDRIFTCGILSM